MVNFLNFSPTLNHLHPVQVENCDSNSRLVVDEGGKFSLEKVKQPWIHIGATSRMLCQYWSKAWKLGKPRNLQHNHCVGIRRGCFNVPVWCCRPCVPVWRHERCHYWWLLQQGGVVVSLVVAGVLTGLHHCAVTVWKSVKVLYSLHCHNNDVISFTALSTSETQW